jgi:hypothetical protein
MVSSSILVDGVCFPADSGDEDVRASRLAPFDGDDVVEVAQEVHGVGVAELLARDLLVDRRVLWGVRGSIHPL